MKNKFITAVLVLSIGFSGILTGSVCAEEQPSSEVGEQDAYPDMGDSEEEQAYREFLQNGDAFSDIKNLSEIMYAVYDIDQDGKNELLLRGKMTNLGEYKYSFYCYKDGTVKTIGSIENWQSAGTGEMYYAPKGKGVVVDMTIAGAKFYSLYQVKNKIKLYFTISRHDGLDDKEVNGELQRNYTYDLEYENGQSAGKDITGKEWDEFENDLIEIPFYDVQVMAHKYYTEEQINILKKALNVPDTVLMTEFKVGDPWYWEGAGRWIVSVEICDKEGNTLAGAAIDPDTLELQREILPYWDGQDEEETEAAQNKNLPFYGIWCYGSKGEGEANSYADTLRSSGFDAQVFMTTDWSNLNAEPFYVVTAGVYGSESEAKAALASVQGVCSQAYVKYSGAYKN